MNSEYRFVRPLDTVRASDGALAGGKGASLGELIHAGFTTPHGFVVLTSAYQEFMRTHTLSPSLLTTLEHRDAHASDSSEDVLSRMREQVCALPIPHDVAEEIIRARDSLAGRRMAVRSSATVEDSQHAAWAGQFESYLNVSDGALLDAVKKCWASVYTPRVSAYRTQQGRSLSIDMAVVVQRMVNATSAGVAFTMHPVTGNRDHIVIEAVRGLGESLVSGTQTPDTLVVSKTTHDFLEVHYAGTAPVLSEEHTKRLCEVVTDIETYYNRPIDVEWAYESDTLFIVQARPITTLI